jgi:hypothetical protein
VSVEGGVHFQVLELPKLPKVLELPAPLVLPDVRKLLPLPEVADELPLLFELYTATLM